MKRVPTKKIAQVLVATMMLFAAAACGRGDSADDQAGPDVSAWTDHDALVKAANREGRLKVLTSMVPETNEALAAGFGKLYPDIDVSVDEQPNDEGQKTLLELQSGQVDYDLLHLGEDGYEEFYPYLADIDLSQLAKDGVINLTQVVINPDSPNMMAAGTGYGSIAYNKDMVDEADVPDSYEDFLDPKWKGKFLVNIEATHFAALYKTWGKETSLDYAKKLAANKPVWTDSDTAGLTVLAAGQYPLFLNNNYHSAYRIQKKTPNLGIKLLDPVPGALVQIQTLRKGAEHPAAAVLFMEYLLTQDAQDAIDSHEPMQGSMYGAGSAVSELIKGEGLNTSLVTWAEFVKRVDWAKEIQEAWGFPPAAVTKK